MPNHHNLLFYHTNSLYFCKQNSLMQYFSSPFTLGILGGGQLGKMLLTETQKWDIRTRVMDASADAPCQTGANEFIQGDLLDYQSVFNFGKGIDVLTIEIENVNLQALFDLQKEGVKVYPKPETLSVIQSKILQKQFYKTQNLPTADFQVFDNLTQLKETLLSGKIQLPFVWKKARFGYDGFGVKVVKSTSDLKGLPDEPCLAEDLVYFKSELAVLVAKSPSGETAVYPVVEMEFHPEANQVEYVICPARIEEVLAKKARNLALQTINALDHVGLLAVEMFLTHSGEILINEVAPRPHNSGHYTIEAAYTSQFEQHLRAILNFPLGNTANKLAGVMVNLVGEEGNTGSVVYSGLSEILQMKGVTPHIYGKKHTRPFRKMGHVTIVDAHVNKAREKAEMVKGIIKVLAKR